VNFLKLKCPSLTILTIYLKLVKYVSLSYDVPPAGTANSGVENTLYLTYYYACILYVSWGSFFINEYSEYSCSEHNWFLQCTNKSCFLQCTKCTWFLHHTEHICVSYPHLLIYITSHLHIYILQWPPNHLFTFVPTHSYICIPNQTESKTCIFSKFHKPIEVFEPHIMK